MIIGQTPKPGDTRSYWAFAWHARDCTDGTQRWLEWVLVREHYTSFDGWVETAVVART